MKHYCVVKFNYDIKLINIIKLNYKIELNKLLKILKVKLNI